MEDERESETARRYFARNNLEGERPTRFFCSMNKKMKSKAQFETIHVKEENERGEEVIRVVTKQSAVEWEASKFYWSLYRKEETFCNKQDILDKIGELKGISEDDRCNLEKEITMEEVSINLKNARNNVAPGAGGFLGSFYKVFWCFLKKSFSVLFTKLSKIGNYLCLLDWI